MKLINTRQIICDQNRRIIDYNVGWPGSVHDKTIFDTMPISTNPARFFSEGEYILGDSAYGLSQYMLIPYSGREYMMIP